jgi:hypothetical protein
MTVTASTTQNETINLTEVDSTALVSDRSKPLKVMKPA